MISKLLNDSFFIRNFVFGLEDSLVSTTGFLVGITFAGVPINYIIKSGIVVIFAEALSMGYGSIISEESFLIKSKMKYTKSQIALYSITMFLSYIIAGFIVLSPYILKLKYNYLYSIFFSLVCLFILIYYIQKNLNKTIKLTILGALVIAISAYIGIKMEKKNV
jgi:VIT1/CCC1 family predicted Fe2+/Mn2+ transporter